MGFSSGHVRSSFKPVSWPLSKISWRSSGKIGGKNNDTIHRRFFIEIIEQYDRRLFDRDCYRNRTIDSSRIQWKSLNTWRFSFSTDADVYAVIHPVACNFVSSTTKCINNLLWESCECNVTLQLESIVYRGKRKISSSTTQPRSKLLINI